MDETDDGPEVGEITGELCGNNHTVYVMATQYLSRVFLRHIV